MNKLVLLFVAVREKIPIENHGASQWEGVGTEEAEPVGNIQ